MKYEWEATFERMVITPIEGGQVVNNQTIQKAGSLLENDTGQNVVAAVLNAEKQTGNLIYLVVKRIE